MQECPTQYDKRIKKRLHMNNSKNKEIAEAFVSFILKDGLQIIENLGQTRVIPSLSEKSENPGFLKNHLLH